MDNNNNPTPNTLFSRSTQNTSVKEVKQGSNRESTREEGGMRKCNIGGDVSGGNLTGVNDLFGS